MWVKTSTQPAATMPEVISDELAIKLAMYKHMIDQTGTSYGTVFMTETGMNRAYLLANLKASVPIKDSWEMYWHQCPRDRQTGGRGIELTVDVLSIGSDEAEVYARRVYGNVGADYTVYLMRRSEGRWVIVKKLNEMWS